VPERRLLRPSTPATLLPLAGPSPEPVASRTDVKFERKEEKQKKKKKI